MRALFFGTYDADTHPRVRVLAEGLRAHDVIVDECNAPLGLSTAARVSMLRHPWQLPRLLFRLATCWLRLVAWARRPPKPDIVVVGYLGHFDVRLARALFPRVPIVLDHLIGASDTARDRGVRGGVRQRLLGWLDDRALRAADVVVVDTAEHEEALPETHRRKAVVVPVGAPTAWFAPAPSARATQAEEPLRVVFFGLFTPLQGAPTIGRALAELADEPVLVTMIGTGQDYEETRRLAAGNAHVTWRDWVPGRELPGIVAAHDVCLGIFGTAPKATRVVPNKVFQGAAAGCAQVTSDTAPQRRLLGDAAVFVPPGDPGALADALRLLAADRARLAVARTAARKLAQDAFTPACVVGPLHDRLLAVVPPEV